MSLLPRFSRVSCQNSVSSLEIRREFLHSGGHPTFIIILACHSKKTNLPSHEWNSYPFASFTQLSPGNKAIKISIISVTRVRFRQWFFKHHITLKILKREILLPFPLFIPSHLDSEHRSTHTEERTG